MRNLKIVNFRTFYETVNIDKIVKCRFKDWIPAPRLRGDRLSGHDVCGIYLILIVLLSFPRRRESRKWENPTFYETIKFINKKLTPSQFKPVPPVSLRKSCIDLVHI